MFEDLLYLLRRNGLKVSLTEWMALMEGLEKNLHSASFTGFYYLCRCLLVKSEADFDAVISANLKGAFLCMKSVSRLMLKQRYGRIVNLSSVVGLRGNAGQVNYAASKAGVIGMTKSLARELAGRGITVNAVAPGFIDTDMTAAMQDSARAAVLASVPMARLGQAEEVARAVAFLAGDDAAYITGQVLAVDGGMAM